MENISIKQRNKMAIISGILLGIIYIILTTFTYKSVGNLVTFYVVKSVGYVIYLVLLGVFISRIKKANGGYLPFKDAFGSVIIIVLIAGIFYFIYNFIYYKYIDPQFMYKLRDTSIHYMQSMGQPDDKIEQATASIDKEIAASKTFNLGNNIMAYLGAVLIDCFFGLLVALIVKKNKPEFAD